MGKFRKVPSRNERHTVTFQAPDIQFTVGQLREILSEELPEDAEVRFTSGHKEGDNYGRGYVYSNTRQASVTIQII